MTYKTCSAAIFAAKRKLVELYDAHSRSQKTQLQADALAFGTGPWIVAA
jgi:hypothetical protein